MVIAAIEYKVPSQLRTEKQIEKAISQELGTAQALQAKVYIITDGKKSIWVNPANGHEILQEDGSKITLNFDKTSAECILLINKIRASINATNDTLKAAASVDPLPLAEKIWQDLWAVSGATPENCLYSVSFVGGIGKVSGIIIGVIMLRLIFVALPLVGMDQNLQYAIKGGIILFACALDMRKYLVKK